MEILECHDGGLEVAVCFWIENTVAVWVSIGVNMAVAAIYISKMVNFSNDLRMRH